jgi:hypothetical protein
VRRGYLRLVSAQPYRTADSGRLQLAEDLTAPSNPLTARVMANRLWYHVFGRGLVGTLDNFGRLGDAPTHPELLDYLAGRLVTQGWSTKAMLRELMLTRAFGLSSDVPAGVPEVDPGNTLLTHARVRRLEAEPVRDGLLFLGRHLDLRAGGPGDDALAEPSGQRRRSVYLTVRRNFLNPFLETFDQPRPFTTLGKRDVTNVPGQSLALLNDPFVLEQAAGWSAAVCGGDANPATDEARVGRFFAEGLGRPATDREVESSRAYLADLRRLHAESSAGHARKEAEAAVWRDFAQSVFNLKEFLYLR